MQVNTSGIQIPNKYKKSPLNHVFNRIGILFAILFFLKVYPLPTIEYPSMEKPPMSTPIEDENTLIQEIIEEDIMQQKVNRYIRTSAGNPTYLPVLTPDIYQIFEPNTMFTTDHAEITIHSVSRVINEENPTMSTIITDISLKNTIEYLDDDMVSHIQLGANPLSVRPALNSPILRPHHTPESSKNLARHIFPGESTRAIITTYVKTNANGYYLFLQHTANLFFFSGEEERRAYYGAYAHDFQFFIHTDDIPIIDNPFNSRPKTITLSEKKLTPIDPWNNTYMYQLKPTNPSFSVGKARITFYSIEQQLQKSGEVLFTFDIGVTNLHSDESAMNDIHGKDGRFSFYPGSLQLQNRQGDYGLRTEESEELTFISPITPFMPGKTLRAKILISIPRSDGAYYLILAPERRFFQHIHENEMLDNPPPLVWFFIDGSDFPLQDTVLK